MTIHYFCAYTAVEIMTVQPNAEPEKCYHGGK